MSLLGASPYMLRHTPLYGCIQIAGIHSAEEAHLLTRAGVHAIGIPLRLPINKEDISEDDAATLIAHAPEYPSIVGITYIDTASEASDFCHALGIRHLQLHGAISLAELAALRQLRPDIYIIKSIVIHPELHNLDRHKAGVEALLQSVKQLEPFVDAFITDTFNPATGASGATGCTHDWRISARIVDAAARPVILAGGLTPENVYDAICAVKPAGVDAHTSVENSNGFKSAQRIQRFVTEAQRGFAMQARTHGKNCPYP